ncbi:CbtA family protein [Paragemmobacter straminiformis]|uniref:CbtA family protein n=1 Tax=Paragemmobacter straminiformis TaxID=2045119 RepID=A0A842I1R1_9RHOB|nr:CbtA family protein [Gemmobacter straminiformis]MBC2834302.1 CbtA family protein [Gemmobacter straminiformis]
MFQRMVSGAVFAGCAAGLIAALLHFWFVQPLILAGEQFESGERVHFAAPAGHAHDHGTAADAAAEGAADGAAVAQAAPDAEAEAGHDHSAHEHGTAGHGTGPDIKRDLLTVAFTVLIYVAYAFILVAGFGAATAMGQRVGPLQGLLWGLGGYAAFQLAPALGLPPELPGSVAADLGARQVWWWATAGLTAAGFLLLGYGRKPWAFVLAGAALALPHVIGAPTLGDYFGVAPPELAAAFAARVLGVGLLAWAALGWIAGHFWSRGDGV